MKVYYQKLTIHQCPECPNYNSGSGHALNSCNAEGGGISAKVIDNEHILNRTIPDFCPLDDK